MEQRQDYTEVQMDLLSRLLRKLLEKLIKTKSFDAHEFLSEKISLCQKAEELIIKDLEVIEDSLLISILMKEYDYKQENLQSLADILYEFIRCNKEDSNVLCQKALIIYEHCLANGNTNIHLSTFHRVQKLKNSLR